MHVIASFVYGLVIGGVDRKSYIQMMELEAKEADSCWANQTNSAGQRFNTSMQTGAAVMAKMGKPGFVRLLFASILFRNEPN